MQVTAVTLIKPLNYITDGIEGTDSPIVQFNSLRAHVLLSYHLNRQLYRTSWQIFSNKN